MLSKALIKLSFFELPQKGEVTNKHNKLYIYENYY